MCALLCFVLPITGVCERECLCVWACVSVLCLFRRKWSYRESQSCCIVLVCFFCVCWRCCCFGCLACEDISDWWKFTCADPKVEMEQCLVQVCLLLVCVPFRVWTAGNGLCVSYGLRVCCCMFFVMLLFRGFAWMVMVYVCRAKSWDGTVLIKVHLHLCMFLCDVLLSSVCVAGGSWCVPLQKLRWNSAEPELSRRAQGFSLASYNNKQQQ